MSQKIVNGNIPNFSLTKIMLWGAGIAFILISVFLYGVQNPNPEWGTLWIVKPLIIVPLAGAIGGAFNYFIRRFQFKASWKKAVIITASLIVYVMALWLGTIAGLNGTLWN